MSITKAIIPVAGWGTRMLPITKAIEKCMLPIGGRPLVDYVVQDCVKAGITEIIFVVSEDSAQLRNYYGINQKLNDYLSAKSKTDKLALVAPIEGVQLHFVVQPADGRYGTGIPVAIASDFVGDDESAVVLMGDDFIWNEDGSSEVARLIEAVQPGDCGLLAAQVAEEDIQKYGVIEKDEADNYVRIVEKPTPEIAPSNLINISKYVLTKEVIEACKMLEPSSRGEYELPDAVNNFVAHGGCVKVVPAQGQYLDGGSPDGWLHANNVVCGQ
ncbi:MAG: sugar phosphate nucleotidyltransferase [Candidatus Saccharimonas sp.]